MVHTAPVAPATAPKPRLVRTAVVVGTALEHYDFFLYGTAAALVFNHQYFASDNPLVASLAAFGAFAVGFVARPFGAVLFGHLGDTVGRRTTLLITLTVVGVATGLIGLIPTYASIGVWAPIALVTLRLVQGISFGGEWAGAVTLATEHAPTGRTGVYASLPQLGSPIGTILSSGAFLVLTLLPQDSFDAWGWRLPFLAAFPMLLFALWIRMHIDESPAFEAVKDSDRTRRVPALQVFLLAPGALVTAAALALLSIGGFFLVTTFAISYGTNTVGLSSATMLTATLSAAVLQIVTCIVAGRLADRIPPVRIALVSCLSIVVLAGPMIWALSSGHAWLAILAVVVLVQPMGAAYAVTGIILPRLFPVDVRYSGVAIGFNIAGLVGGFVPMIATSLLIATDSSAWPIAVLLVVIALISAAGTWAAGLRTSRTGERS